MLLVNRQSLVLYLISTHAIWLPYYELSLASNAEVLSRKWLVVELHICLWSSASSILKVVQLVVWSALAREHSVY